MSAWAKDHLMDFIVIVVVACGEIFVFNLPFWQTSGATSEQTVVGKLGPGLEKQEDGMARVVDVSQAWVEVSGADPIDYLRVNPSPVGSPQRTVTWLMHTKKSTDGGFYASSGSKRYAAQYGVSHYIHIGNGANIVRLIYQVQNGDMVSLDSFTINPRIPFRVPLTRAALEACIAMLIIAFRPGSHLYRRRFSLHDLWCVTGLIVVLVMQVAFVVAVWLMAGGNESASGFGKMMNSSMFDFDQYAQIANSLIHGKVYLDFPVNPDLAKMANPYNALSRFGVARHSSYPDPILFDVAFHEGKYYSYFGVLPAVVLFVPYKLITGQDLKVGFATLVFALLIVVCSLFLVVQLARLFSRKMHGVSAGTVLLVVSAVPLGYPIFTVLQQVLFYQLPQTLGVAILLFALACWVESKIRGLSKGWLGAGSFFMGLIVACRPQLVLGAVVAFPLFWSEISDLWRSGLHSRRSFAHELAVWAAALLPFIAAVIPALLYNQARFGSLFDFGANYNLTGFDMTHQRLPWAQLFPLAFLYFAQPSNIATQFPFVHPTMQTMPRWLPMQPSFGGLFTALAPFACVIFAACVWRKGLCKVKTGGLFVVLASYAAVVFAFDAHQVGYDVRYILDFGWAIMMMFALFMISMDLYRAEEELSTEISSLEGSSSTRIMLPEMSDISKIVTGFVVAAIILAYLFSFFSGFKTNPTKHDEAIWWNVYSWFQFV